jgi:hypothetical protein
MSKSRVMGAGLAGSTNLGVCVNANGAGGSKKQGLARTVGLGMRTISEISHRTDSTPAKRNMIYSMSQLSGVGRGRSPFNIPGMYTHKDAGRTVAPFPFVGWCKIA